MASQFTPEEIQDIFEQYENSIKANGRASEELTKKYKDAQAGIKGYTDAMKSSLQGLGTSFKNLAGDMADGGKGVSQYNDAIKSGANYVGTWLSAKGPWGQAGSMMIKGAAAYVAAVTKQADSLFKSYQDISRAGLQGKEGVQGLYRDMQDLGYGIKELGELAAVVKENATTLTFLGGTVTDGTKAFSKMSSDIRNSDLGLQFEKMGITVDQENRGIANYLKVQTLAGQVQLKTQTELKQGAEEYILQQDRLTKLTGLSADAQQNIREQALSEERFAASQYKLRKENNEDEANAREEFNTYLRGKGLDETAKGFRDFSSGMLNSPEAQMFLRSFPDAAKKIQEGAKMDDVQEAMRQNARTLADNNNVLALAGSSNAAGYAKYNEAVILAGDTSLKAAKENVKDQQGVTDSSTDALAKTARAQRETRDSLQDLKQIGITPVTRAMQGLSQVIAGITGAGAGIVKTVAPTGAGGTKGGAEGFDKAKAGATVSGTPEARRSAERYLGKPISDEEFSSLVKATHAEAAGGKKASQQEQAMIMASILNRARDDKGGIMGALTAKNQFQSVTGTAANGHAPSQNYLTGPQGERLKSIEGATTLLDNISKQQKNFTAADSDAYGAGTNIGYRDKMLAAGGQVVGGSVFQTSMPTGPTTGYQNQMAANNVPAPQAPTNQVAQAQQQLGLGAGGSDNHMASFNSKLDELVRLQQQNNAINNKILQRQQ
jgi:hypothetical protein